MNKTASIIYSSVLNEKGLSEFRDNKCSQVKLSVKEVRKIKDKNVLKKISKNIKNARC